MAKPHDSDGTGRLAMRQVGFATPSAAFIATAEINERAEPHPGYLDTGDGRAGVRGSAGVALLPTSSVSAASEVSNGSIAGTTKWVEVLKLR